MADDNPEHAPEKAKPADLTDLKNLSFGINWSSTSEGGEGGARRERERERGERRGPPGSGARPPRDRRPHAPGRGGDRPAGGAWRGPAGGGSRPFGDRPRGDRPEGREGGAPERRDFRGEGRPGGRTPVAGRGAPRPGAELPFRPTVDVLFYPEDAPFRALTKAMRASCRTYELFEIAKVILEKNDGFLVVVKPRKGRQGEPAQTLFLSAPDGLPFEREDEAVTHVFKQHLDKFFTIEETTVEPPKGTFVGINKCGMTGELLGPPNYHRYQALLHEHHTTRLPHVSFERFLSRVELVKDPEVVQQWLQKMTKSTRYVLKLPLEGEQTSFESLESARHFLLNKRKEQLVRAVDQVRFAGKLIETLPQSNIRRSVEAVLDHQRRFPLDTANNLRGRLRRMKFSIYKKGSKGVSYVCAVKRKFRTPGTVFADSIQQVLTFIEQHAMVNVADLPQEFLGLPKSVAAAPTEQPLAPAEAVEQPTADQVAAPARPRDVEVAGLPVAPESEGAVTAPAEAETAPVAPEVETKAEPAGPTLTPEQDARSRQLMLDLRWLVTEGYVTEYGDGRLFAPPPLPEKQAAQAAAEEEDAGDEVSVEEVGGEDLPKPIDGPEKDLGTIPADGAEGIGENPDTQETPPGGLPH